MVFIFSVAHFPWSLRSILAVTVAIYGAVYKSGEYAIDRIVILPQNEYICDTIKRNESLVEDFQI